MNCKKYSLLFTFLIGLTSLKAQNPPIKWGKVDLEDLKMETYAQDSTASAVILADYATMAFDFRYEARFVFTHHRRIKVLDPAKFNYSDITINLYGQDQIRELKAQTIVGGSGQAFKLKSQDFFEEDVTEGVKVIKFSFPNLKKGAVVEYSYTINSERVGQLRPWFFQHDIPTRWSELRLEIPEWLEYIFLSNGKSPDINEQKASSSLRRGFAGAAGVYQDITRHRIAMKNVPALQEEAFITNMDDYRISLRFQLQSIKAPNQPIKNILTTWPDLAQELLYANDFGKQFGKKANQTELLEAIQPHLPAEGTPSEKALAAYYYLQRTLEWNGEYWYRSESSILDCFERKSANSGELNMILMAILNAMDIECYPVLLSTRNHGRMIQLYPIVQQFNHLVTIAQLNDEMLILDLSNDQRPAGLPRKASLNQMGWLVSKTNPQWVSIIPPRSSTVRMFKMDLQETGDLSLQVQTKTEGYHAVNIRELTAAGNNEESLAQELRELYPESMTEALSVTIPQNPVEALKTGYKAEVPGAARAFNDYLYFSPCILPYFEENPFQKPDRSYPVDIAHPFDVRDVFIVKVPKGYELEGMPETTKIALPGQAASFEFKPTYSGGNINLVYSLRFKKTHFESEEYPSLKEFLDLVIEKQGEPFVFRKKT